MENRITRNGGTLDELKYNLNDLSKRYNMDVVVRIYCPQNWIERYHITLPGGNEAALLSGPLLGNIFLINRERRSIPTQYLPGNSGRNTVLSSFGYRLCTLASSLRPAPSAHMSFVDRWSENQLIVMVTTADAKILALSVPGTGRTTSI